MAAAPVGHSMPRSRITASTGVGSCSRNTARRSAGSWPGACSCSGISPGPKAARIAHRPAVVTVAGIMAAMLAFWVFAGSPRSRDGGAPRERRRSVRRAAPQASPSRPRLAALQALRLRIDEQDLKILRAMEERGRIVEEVLALKQSAGFPAFDAIRERQLLQRLHATYRRSLPVAGRGARVPHAAGDVADIAGADALTHRR